MGKIATTWQLMKDSWHVLMRDKALIAFPVVSAVACFLVFLAFVGPFIGVNVFREAAGSTTSEALTWVVLFCYYLCNFFVVIFFNAALVDFVVTRMRGGEPTVGGSLKAATAHLPQIAAWSLVSATVGVILQALSSRAGFLGRIVISLVGVAWALLTYFVVPFVIVERKGAFEAIGASKDLLARTWGQQLVSGLGYGLIGFLLTLPGIVLVIVAAVGAGAMEGHYWGAWALLAVAAVLYIIALGIVMSTLRAIFGTVLFLYARTGEAPPGFSPAALRGAIQVRPA